MCPHERAARINPMSDTSLFSFSDGLADIVSAVSQSVVQVHGRRRPCSGLVYDTDRVLTTMRSIGREDGPQVRTDDARTITAELTGWDPATGLALLHVPDLNLPAVRVAERPARVGHLAVAIARSWSNNITASVGNIAVIGGPLPTWRGRGIAQVIRTTAPMHEGFSGGAFVDVDGGLMGVATAAAIRGLGVVIPTSIAWETAATLRAHGGLKRGYIGIAGQPVRLTDRQRGAGGPEAALLVVNVGAETPADAGGLLVGDVIVSFDGEGVVSPEDLLDLLRGDRVGRAVPVRILRGGTAVDLTVTPAERSESNPGHRHAGD